MYAPFGEHSLYRFRRGLDGDRTDTSGADQVGVIGKQFLDEAVHVMTVGEAVMNVEGRLRLSVADGHSEVDQRLALVEVERGAFGRRIIELHHLDSRGEKVIGDDLMPPVGPPLEASGKDRARFEQRIVGSRQGVDIDRALHVRAKPHKIVCLGEHFLAIRQLPNDRRWKHFQTLLCLGRR